MKLSKILAMVAGGIVREVVPGGGLLLDVVNAALPDGAKLGPDSTGPQLSAAVASLPPIQQAEIMAREFDVAEVQIRESNETLRAMIAADAVTPHTTRPFIVRGSFFVAGAVSIAAVSIWAYAVINADVAMLIAVNQGWPLVAAIVSPFMIIIHAYFGVLRDERRGKLEAATGSPLGGVAAGLVGKLLNK